MKLGKLNFIYNNDKHQAADDGYHHVLVYDAVEREYENLMITKSEMGRIRLRARNNPEDCVSPSWVDGLIALFFRVF